MDADLFANLIDSIIDSPFFIPTARAPLKQSPAPTEFSKLTFGVSI